MTKGSQHFSHFSNLNINYFIVLIYTFNPSIMTSLYKRKRMVTFEDIQFHLTGVFSSEININDNDGKEN